MRYITKLDLGLLFLLTPLVEISILGFVLIKNKLIFSLSLIIIVLYLIILSSFMLYKFKK